MFSKSSRVHGRKPIRFIFKPQWATLDFRQEANKRRGERLKEIVVAGVQIAVNPINRTRIWIRYATGYKAVIIATSLVVYPETITTGFATVCKSFGIWWTISPDDLQMDRKGR